LVALICILIGPIGGRRLDGVFTHRLGGGGGGGGGGGRAPGGGPRPARAPPRGAGGGRRPPRGAGRGGRRRRRRPPARGAGRAPESSASWRAKSGFASCSTRLHCPITRLAATASSSESMWPNAGCSATMPSRSSGGRLGISSPPRSRRSPASGFWKRYGREKR